MEVKEKRLKRYIDKVKNRLEKSLNFANLLNTKNLFNKNIISNFDFFLNFININNRKNKVFEIC